MIGLLACWLAESQTEAARQLEITKRPLVGQLLLGREMSAARKANWLLVVVKQVGAFVSC